jgi:hypothetical protein
VTAPFLKGAGVGTCEAVTHILGGSGFLVGEKRQQVGSASHHLTHAGADPSLWFVVQF